ncbi:hypothetical protein JN086_11275 [Mycolicibacterium austroafricanum]|uniref:PKD domain-containing protein n=1 Tax=Mycolicibacterium austroafricanum TaxID=39687 RepID=A0ABT8HLC9_MYCAO|nr:hypothetical protein [Mycolicibacterium austroafricanum]MDN4521568.1 hypothetical protein [Mycolicibacterium austroafricanum]QRZ09393.1 hypothetical protein JN090_13340 [Mycolicibacterium austroafricanum]QZT70511.1 hypothetical protein JN086_11275 [Mycolicibacterium austroafricanum]
MRDSLCLFFAQVRRLGSTIRSMRGALVAACIVVAVVLLAGCNQTSGAPTAAPVPTMSATETASALVKQSMQQKFDTDEDLSELHLQVVDVVLVNKAGNEYKGLATVRTQKGTERDVPVEATFDGDNIIWESPPGALLFALQEQNNAVLPPAAAPQPAPPAVLQPSRGGMVYIATKSGKTRCQIRSSEIDCQAPFTNTPFVGGHRANGVTFRSDGTYEWVVGDLGDIPVTTLDYRTYRALSWTIDASYTGTRFTHSGTGRSVFVSVDGVRFG